MILAEMVRPSGRVLCNDKVIAVLETAVGAGDIVNVYNRVTEPEPAIYIEIFNRRRSAAC